MLYLDLLMSQMVPGWEKLSHQFSSMLFIDDLSEDLRKLQYGCFNHIIYADDTVLLSSSPHALQQHGCADYIRSNF